MDELYIENFAIKEKTTHPFENKFLQGTTENKPIEIELIHQMVLYLDRLEREITLDYKDFSDFRFIFEKMRKIIKKNSVEGVLDLLADLEEILDLAVPSISLRG